ncbi:MAG: CopD family protein [Candidatus Bathyarchaeia archaeon]
MTDLWQLVGLSILNFLHLLATVVWVGGMATNILVTLPSTREVLEPAVFGRFIGAIMKRFRLIAYVSIITLLVCGVLLTLVNENFVGGPFDNAWSQLILAKHLFVAALVLLTVYSFEVLAPKVAKLAAKGPSPELLKTQKLQLRLASTGFVLGLVILMLIAIVLSL